MELNYLEQEFKKHSFKSEDDIKINFHAEIVNPILKQFNPLLANTFKSEDILKSGGRTDATFQNVCFEYKKYDYFKRESGINEALYGRNDTDHGLYDYIISSADFKTGDDGNRIMASLLNGVGVGFDGVKFVFARFIPSSQKNTINTKKLKADSQITEKLNVEFRYEVKDFSSGLKRLVLILRQKDKITLNKKTLCDVINPKSSFVRCSIWELYKEIDICVNNVDTINNRVRTLYKEWDRVFGIMYGEDDEATDFTEVSSKIRDAYGIEKDLSLDSKMYLFSMQTFFNIFLKLLVYSFLSQLVDPMFIANTEMEKQDINRLFDGASDDTNRLVDNFFESHFLEWFTFTNDEFDVSIVNNVMGLINSFDLSTFVLKPESVQDILQEVYMGLIPAEMRHLMGEYFSPDWIVEHVLDMVGYTGEIGKTIMDPTAGSGPFLTQAIKRVIKKNNGIITKHDIEMITQNIVGFDINPISVVAAKANYILILFSAFFDSCDEEFGEAVSIPVFIADSILAPVVYTEENDRTLKLNTSVGVVEIPKFDDFSKGNEFLKLLSQTIDDRTMKKDVFLNLAIGRKMIKEEDRAVVSVLFDKLYNLHRAGQDSFWPIIFRNSFAPIMIRNKFDYVVGNPPWIAWKAMSKSYRNGTLTIWQSYGIFEKNAYDKKTTHDDFGMAVTYVAIDQYLKEDGEMVFLLPASFLKSTKGGEGFRKFDIIRNEQNIPFAVSMVHDFSNVNLFTIPTVAIKFKKGTEMSYPMNNYCAYSQIGRKSKIDSHATWKEVSDKIVFEALQAQPVDPSNTQSAWLTLKDMSFANNVLNANVPRYYKGRKGIEPAGAKGVYILKTPQKVKTGYLKIENDMSRQRRQDIIDKGSKPGVIEENYVYPMLGGRNIARWEVKSNEFMLVPHTSKYKYGIPEDVLAKNAPETFQWLNFYHDELLATRIQNGKFYNRDTQPFYRLDNVGTYTYAPYKVLWKEQTGSMSAVVVGTYLESIPNADKDLFSEDKEIVVDSKVLMLDVYDENEAFYVCGIINAPEIIKVVDGYAISTNRGVDVLKYIAIPKFDPDNKTHMNIAIISKQIHEAVKEKNINKVKLLEEKLDIMVHVLFE
ncbi:N-6 DNA Methylase [Eubacterium ruminantium]|nr:N-6 DNA Methylase [Eubacterium ruminantium]